MVNVKIKEIIALLIILKYFVIYLP